MTSISQYKYQVKGTDVPLRKDTVITGPDDKLKSNQNIQAQTTPLIGANTVLALKTINITPQNKKINNSFKIEDVKDLILGMLEARHPQTKQHSQGVAIYAKAVAEELKLSPDKVKEIETGAMFHDIGKISLPDDFFKQKNLTPSVICLCKNHPLHGSNILSNLAPLSPTIINIAKYHHEKYDGTGYPEGLKGNNIPFEVQLASIADAFDSMTRKKYPNQNVKTFDQAIEVLKENKSGQWNPALIDPFISVVTGKNNALYKHVLLNT